MSFSRRLFLQGSAVLLGMAARPSLALPEEMSIRHAARYDARFMGMSHVWSCRMKNQFYHFGAIIDSPQDLTVLNSKEKEQYDKSVRYYANQAAQSFKRKV